MNKKLAMNENSSKATINNNKMHHIFAGQQWQTDRTDLQSSGISVLQTYIFLFDFFFIRFSPIPSISIILSTYRTLPFVVKHSQHGCFIRFVRKRRCYQCSCSYHGRMWAHVLNLRIHFENMGLILNTYTIKELVMYYFWWSSTIFNNLLTH